MSGPIQTLDLPAKTDTKRLPLGKVPLNSGGGLPPTSRQPRRNAKKTSQMHADKLSDSDNLPVITDLSG
ncbi:hypothetical protein ALO76_101615 [Pseudomonas syringae pv. coriandricola]|nr:hypothetical protein ALO76_101615 [Pseudomonas syringae pv. coriandricola]